MLPYCYCFMFMAVLALPAIAWAGETDTDAETRFFQAIDCGDVDGVMETLHPSALRQVDREVMAAWLGAIDERLGQQRSIKQTAESRTYRLTGSRVETTSTVEFQRGTAQAKITQLDGRIIDFNVKSDAMRNWFHGPTDVRKYEQTARRFIGAFFAADSSRARELMHPALREAIAPDDFEAMIAKVTGNGGELQSLELAGQRFSLDGKSPALFLTYNVSCERASGTCEIEFQFVGMKGCLLGFDFK